MQFYDLFKELISHIPERYGALINFFDAVLPLALMVCALLTAFLGVKLVKWWCTVTFFFLGSALVMKTFSVDFNLYSKRFLIASAIAVFVGILFALLSTYLSRIQIAASEFMIVYSALPPLMFYLGNAPAAIVSVVIALAVVFLTVRYKYLILLPVTSFSGSFIFWEAALKYVDIGNETLNGIIMGLVAFAFQCYISSEQLKETYKDVKMKYDITKKEGERAVHYVERKIHNPDVHLKNIRIKGAKNVRDLGGLPVEGGRIKKNKFIRSGNLSKINAKGADLLYNQLHLRTVIDLRNSMEKAEKPNYKIDNVNYTELSVFDSSIPGLSHETKQNLDAVPDMTELYAAVVNSSCLMNLCKVVRKIIRLPDEELSVLYHCTEGKDRTGMVTALLLTILGANREVILEDYLFTNKTNRKKAAMYFFLVSTVKHNKVAAHKVFNVFVAREEYINELFKVIDKIGYEKLIKEYIKVTDEELESFKKRVIE